MAKLTRDDVLKLAQLSHIVLSEEEVEEFASELSEILQYVEQLQQVNVGDLEPTSQVTGLTNVMRPDELHDYGYKAKDLLINVPEVQRDLIKVRRVL
jgi:aspartyl-tRNA(Asn)/glutamyl-tRNA(Gln) amidotransferase subunit C